MKILLIAIVAIAALAASGCQTAVDSPRNSPLTHGNVTLNLKKGETTQSKVLEIFGPPNIATTDAEGNEVWTYQRHASVSKSSESFATIVLAGAQTSGFSQSSRTMTLIIKFDSQKRVIDFKSMSSSF